MNEKTRANKKQDHKKQTRKPLSLVDKNKADTKRQHQKTKNNNKNIQQKTTFNQLNF